MNPNVDWFFEKDTKWRKEYNILRAIILDCGLKEELKWGCPCYTFKGSNIVLIHGFKNYCALLFHKGALLNDANQLLVQQTENVQSARQLRFTGIDEIKKLEQTISACVYEAVEVEKAGLEVKMKKTSEYEMPVELELAFLENPDFKTAFDQLTPGRQRGYLLHFSRAKKTKTRQDRINKQRPKIFEGKGYNER